MSDRFVLTMPTSGFRKGELLRNLADDCQLPEHLVITCVIDAGSVELRPASFLLWWRKRIVSRLMSSFCHRLLNRLVVQLVYLLQQRIRGVQVGAKHRPKETS